MRPILYATDFSENAEKAFIYALKLAQKQKAELIMLHIYDIPTSWEYSQLSNADDMERDAERVFKNKLREVFKQHAILHEYKVKADFRAIENSSVAEGIISVIKQTEPQLVVIGTRGGSRLKELITGSTTRALLRKSPCPVLAIPLSAPEKDLKEIVYATDFFEKDVEALAQLVEIVRPFAPRIVVLHVSLPLEYAGDEKAEWFKEMVLERVHYVNISFQVVLSDDVYKRLNSYLTRYDVDLLVMLEKERTGVVDKLFHSDLVAAMEFRTQVPLLSFNEQFLPVTSIENAGEIQSS